MTDLTMSIDDFSKRILQPSMSILAAAIDVEFQAAARIQSLEAELSIAKRGLSGLAVYPGPGAGARKIASEILARMTNA